MEALINPKILKWSRKRAKFSIEELAKKIGIKNNKEILLWEKGEKKPTFLQARKLAEALYIPFGYLYLDEVPKEEISIPNLRVNKLCRIRPELYKLINELELRQDWYREYLIKQGVKPLGIVGKYSINTSYEIIAKDIIDKLNLRDRQRKELLDVVIDSCEEIGISIMRDNIPLKDFQGLFLNDKIAPIIFLNTKETKDIQLFTLIYELVYIWIGKSNLSFKKSIKKMDKTEKLCYKVADEVLVLLKDRCKSVVKQTKQDNINNLSFNKYGKNFTKALLTSTINMQTTLLETERLLGIHSSKIFDFAKEVGVIKEAF